MADDRVLQRKVRRARDAAAIIAGAGGDTVQIGRGVPDHGAAIAIADDEHRPAVLQEIDAGGDVGQGVGRFGLLDHGEGLGHAGVVGPGFAGGDAVIHRRRHGFETQGGPALDIGLHIFVEAKDFLDHDHPAPSLALRLAVKGAEFEAIGGGALDLDHVGHAGVPLEAR